MWNIGLAYVSRLGAMNWRGFVPRFDIRWGIEPGCDVRWSLVVVQNAWRRVGG